MARKWIVDEDFWGRTTVEEEDNGDGGFAAFVLLSLFFSILAAIVAVIVSFVAVGVLFGTFTSIKNYIKGVRCHSLNIGQTFVYTWNANEQRMRDFFDDAVKYDRNHDKHGILVKTFYITSGIGVILVGTLLLIVCAAIHSVLGFFVWIIKKMIGEGNTIEPATQNNDVKLQEQTLRFPDDNAAEDIRVKRKKRQTK